MSNSFDNWCPEVYRSVFVDRFNDDFVRVAPCCQAETRLEPADTFDFVSSPYLNQIREKFNQGEQPKECNQCWEVEKYGHKSRRLSAIEFFKNTIPDNNVQLQSIDHNATWACNLACVMCGPYNSSFWATQQNLDKQSLKLLGRLFQKSNNILNRLNFEQVKKIHFNGGEPMLNNDQFELLTKLEEQNILQDVIISYNTNGTIMPNEKIINLWSKTRLVKLFFSIDAVGPAFEYIRWPAKWSDVSKNILNMKAVLPSNVLFGINVTIGSYNILEIADVYDWFEQNIQHNREGDQSDFCWQLTQNFKSDINYLPLDIKSTAIEQLKSIAALRGIVNNLQSTINYDVNLDWMDMLEAVDGIRNTNWKNSLKISKFIREKTC